MDEPLQPLWKKNPHHFYLQFEITGKCNLRCTHCYDDSSTHEHMPYHQCIEVLDKFIAFCQKWKRFPAIWLTGGEPTIHPDFWDILDYLEGNLAPGSFYVAILTNGLNVTSDFVQKLQTYCLGKYVQISVDGACAETHDSIRGRGSFDKAIHALEVLKSTEIETHIHFVVHRGNYEDGFKMTDLAQKMGADVLTVTRLVPWGRGRELYDAMLTPEQVKILFKKLSDDLDTILAQKLSKPLIARGRCDWPVIYPDPSTEEAFTKNGTRCGAGRSYMNIMENGDVYVCRRLPLKIGNILEQDLMNIWQHPILWKLRQKHRFVQGKCLKCFFTVHAPEVCSGGASCIAYACCDDPFQPDPQCPVNPSESPAGV